MTALLGEMTAYLGARGRAGGVSALGAPELSSDEDVARVRRARRDDLPGQPLAWQVAMRTLVARGTGREI